MHNNPNKNLSKPKGYFKRLKNFLDSGSTEAKITTVVLCALALASLPVLVMGAVAMGNTVQLLGGFKTSKNYSKKQIWNAIGNLKRQKMIKYIQDKGGRTIVEITAKGKTKLRSFTIDLMEIPRPNKWDGKWRLVMFDIPMRFTKGREALRYHLKDLDFFQFQKSAWIYPYPCEDEIIFITDFYGVGKFVEILTVENMLDDQKPRKHFQALLY